MARNYCSIENCDGVCVGFGLCSKHYQRLTYHKNPEVHRGWARKTYHKRRDKILEQLRASRSNPEVRLKANKHATECRLRKWFGIPAANKGGPPGQAGVEEYNRRLAEQGGGCALCNRRPGETRLGVDHNHGSGKVRGLLCDFCNGRILGRLENARHRVTLPKLTEYLQKHDPDNVLLKEMPSRENI